MSSKSQGYQRLGGRVLGRGGEMMQRIQMMRDVELDDRRECIREAVADHNTVLQTAQERTGEHSHIAVCSGGSC